MQQQSYYKRLESIEEPGTIFVKWNWAACLLGPVWFAYRRCYLYAFLTLLIEVSYGSYLVIIGSGVVKYSLTSLIPLRILIGMIGTSLYFRKWIKGRMTHGQHTSLIMGTIVFILYTMMASSFTFTKPFHMRFSDIKPYWSFEFREFKNPDTFDPGRNFPSPPEEASPITEQDDMSLDNPPIEI